MYQNDHIEIINEIQDFNLLKNNPYSKILITCTDNEDNTTNYTQNGYKKIRYIILCSRPAI